MKTQPAIRAALAAVALPSSRTASLRSVAAFSAAGVSVDMENAVISNVAVMTIGPADGHGWSVDRTTLDQLAALINESPIGVPIRFRHPEMPGQGEPMPETLGTEVGYLRNARVEGDAVRGDVYLLDYAEVLPVLGNVKNYLLRKAKSDPTGIGLSPVVHIDLEQLASPAGAITLYGRVAAVDAVDFVGKGATTPNGLLSAATKQVNPTPAGASPVVAPAKSTKPILTGVSKMDPKLKQYLTANYGLAADASDEDAQKMFDGMTPDQQAEAKSKAEQLSAVTTKAPAQLASKVKTDAGDEFLAIEGRRVAQLRQLGDTLAVDAPTIQLAIAQGDDVMKARTRYLEHLATKCKPVENLGGGATITVGEDRNRTTLVAALSDTLRLKAQCRIEKPHERATQLRGLKFIELGRHYLAAHGVNDAWDISGTKVYDMLFKPQMHGWRYAQLAQSSGSFTNITLDAANKTLRQAYLDGTATWTRWARRATAPDFKNVNRIALSDSPGLSSRTESGEIKFAVMSDTKESYALSEYSSGIRLTRQAIINDDMDAFGRIPQLQGSAARRKEDDVTYTILTANAALADAVALFHATHSNYTSSGTAISVASLGVGRKALRVQTGPKGAYLNLIPRFLIVPAALESIAEQYTSSQFVAAISSSVNPFATNMSTPLAPIVEPRLDADSATKWYLGASNDQIDTVEVCFLQDEPEPVLKQEVDFDTDDVKFAVRHTVAAKAIDYRGLYLNAGA